jgi:hypothetical protein
MAATYSVAKRDTSTKSEVVQAMERIWCRVRPLMDGTLAMRDAGVLVLPRFPVESMDAYAARRDSAVLFPAYERTNKVLIGKIFSKPFTFGEYEPQKPKEGEPAPKKTKRGLHPTIVDWSDDIDLEGHNMQAFWFEVAIEAAAFGLCGVLSEYPDLLDKETGQPRAMSMAQKIDEGVRPWHVHIHHDQILGWKTERVGGIGGPIRLRQLRLKECVEVDDGEYHTKTVEQVRIIERDRWWIQRKNTKGQMQKVPDDQGGSGINTLGYIPFTPVYGRRRGFMQGDPLCKDLIFQNIKHWQSQSDQDHILHVARVPILAAFGVDPISFKLEISTSAAVKMPKDSDLKYIEHTGACIEAGERSLKALEEQMVTTGAELLIPTAGGGEAKTATQANNDADANKSDLQRFAEMLEDTIDTANQQMADWEKLGEAGHVTIFKEFNESSLTDASAQLVLALRTASIIQKITVIKEMQRRNVLHPDLDAKAEVDAVEKEPPPLALVLPGTRPPRPGDPKPPAPVPAPAPRVPVPA